MEKTILENAKKIHSKSIREYLTKKQEGEYWINNISITS